MEIETLEFEYPETRTVVEYEYPELTAVCPMTGLPDFYTVRIVFEPDKKLPELKSLKLYFVSFRNMGILHENLANRIHIQKPCDIKLHGGWAAPYRVD